MKKEGRRKEEKHCYLSYNMNTIHSLCYNSSVQNHEAVGSNPTFPDI